MTDLIDDDQEWTVESFLAECDRVAENPPTPPDGIVLIECTADPRHWPTYAAYVDGMYESGCPLCERDDLYQQLRKIECDRKHRRWKSWQIWSRISGRLYVLGITSSGGGTWFGRCEFCGLGRQHFAPTWKGKRPYIFGLRRETWACLRRGHRRSDTYYGLCSICCPCPSCGSTDPSHSGDCGDAA